MIKHNITGNNNSIAEVSSDGYLHTLQKPYFEYNNIVRFFVNETHGDNLAINASALGTPIDVYNADDSYWTLSNIIGSGFAPSAAQNHTPAGTNSLDFSAAVNQDIGQLLGSETVLSTANTLEGWIYLTYWYDTSKNISFYGYNSSTGLQVGDSILLSDYINTTSLNNWQKFNIPLSDMNLISQTIDSIRIVTIDPTSPGGAPNGYLDDIQFVGAATGGPYEYIIEPQPDEELSVTNISYALSANYDNTLANSNMPNISYNKLLNLSLIDGLLYSRWNNNMLSYSVNWRNIIEILSSPGTTISNFGSDGTSVFMTILYTFAEPTILRYSRRDKITIDISENFSSLNFFKVSTNCKLREI